MWPLLNKVTLINLMRGEKRVAAFFASRVDLLYPFRGTDNYAKSSFSIILRRSSNMFLIMGWNISIKINSSITVLKFSQIIFALVHPAVFSEGNNLKGEVRGWAKLGSCTLFWVFMEHFSLQARLCNNIYQKFSQIPFKRSKHTILVPIIIIIS